MRFCLRCASSPGSREQREPESTRRIPQNMFREMASCRMSRESRGATMGLKKNTREACCAEAASIAWK